jgi:hypothetical protein
MKASAYWISCISSGQAGAASVEVDGPGAGQMQTDLPPPRSNPICLSPSLYGFGFLSTAGAFAVAAGIALRFQKSGLALIHSSGT